MKKILVIILSVFAFVACSKDDNVPFVASMDDLNNTFWQNGSYHQVVYDPDGSVLKDYYRPADAQLDGGWLMYYISSNSFISVSFPSFGSCHISERACIYQPDARLLKINSLVYTVLEMSRSRLVLRYTEMMDSNTVITTKEYLPYKSDKTWKEWLKYIDEYNAEML